MSKNRLYQVLLSPRVTEKTTQGRRDSNQYVFRVIKDANKSEVKGCAVEMLFDVMWSRFASSTSRARRQVIPQRPGKRSDWKKAYVRVQEGQVIDFLGGESA